MKRYFFLAAIAAAAFVSCDKADVETPNVPESSRIVKFTTQNLYSFDTKAALAVSGHVAIYAGAPINVKNADYTVASMPTAEPAAAGTLTGDAILWGIEQIGTNTDTKFFAMYPYAVSDDRNAFDAEHPLPYSIDASAESEAYAKDFLVDVVDQHPGADVEHPNTVSFALEHPFVLLRYVITNASDDTIKKVEISGVHKDGTLAYATAAVTPTGEAIAANAAREMPLESEEGNVKTFYSVIMPESVAINPTIKITTWGGCTSTYSLSAAQTFLAGKSYTASITYSNTHTAVTSNRTMTADFDVEPWSAASNPTVGDQANYDDNADNWPIIKGVGISGCSWDGGLAMTCVGDNSYRKVITLSGDGAHEFKVYKASGTGVWYGFSSTETVDGWTKIVTTTGDAANVSITGDADATFTIYYYEKDNSDPHEIWVKAGDVTR